VIPLSIGICFGLKFKFNLKLCVSVLRVFSDILLPEYWGVLSSSLGENEINHFSGSPYCVAVCPHTSIGVVLLAGVRFQNMICS
jgi:hypothetical protein